MRMHMFSAAAAAVATLALLGGAVAPATAHAQGKIRKVDPADVPMNKRVCIENSAVTGSRIRSRICKTRAEWIAHTGIDPIEKK